MATLKKLLKKRKRLNKLLEDQERGLINMSGNYRTHFEEEYHKTQLKLEKAERRIETEEWRHDSEELEALHMNLDDARVPRYDEKRQEELSAWGRVVRFKNG